MSVEIKDGSCCCGGIPCGGCTHPETLTLSKVASCDFPPDDVTLTWDGAQWVGSESCLDQTGCVTCLVLYSLLCDSFANRFELRVRVSSFSGSTTCAFTEVYVSNQIDCTGVTTWATAALGDLATCLSTNCSLAANDCRGPDTITFSVSA